uniref:3'-5' exonuclease domain-containing protein n=1 Tax=Panagrolaimus davidi TaxID=227884 RepID=A0A914QIC6_9BILA
MEPKKKKNPKQRKPNPMDHKSVPISSHLPSNTVEDTAKELKNSFGSNEFSNILGEFLRKRQGKHLRAATMTLTHKTQSLFREDVDKMGIIKQIILGFNKFLKEKEDDKQFLKDVKDGNVQFNRDSFRDAMKLDVTKYFDVLDQLYHFNEMNSRKKNFADFCFNKMRDDLNTRNNGDEWIKKFEKLKQKNSTSTTASSQDIVAKLVEKTAEKLCYFYSNYAPSEFRPCISDFYSNCLKEWLRIATMDLIYRTYILMSKIKSSDPSLIIFQILLGYEAFITRPCKTTNWEGKKRDNPLSLFFSFLLRYTPFGLFLPSHARPEKEKGEEFFLDVYSAEISDDRWKKSFKVAFKLRCAIFQKKCAIFRKQPPVISENVSFEILPAFDLLFKVNAPENEARKVSILDNIRELLGNEKTLNIGIERVQALKLDLENFKNDSEASDVKSDNPPWSVEAQNMVEQIEVFEYDFNICTVALDKFYDDPTDPKWVKKQQENRQKKLQQKGKPDAKIFVVACPLKLLRPATMELLLLIDLTKEASSDIIYYICQKYYTAFFAHAKQVNVKVSDKLWSNAWKICIANRKLRDLRSSPPMEALFRINQPETNNRKDVIDNAIRDMLSKNETFYTAINWINKYNNAKLKEEQFGHVDIYECIFQKGRETEFAKFDSNDDRIRYLKKMDNFLKQVATDTLPVVCKAQKKEFVIEKLLKENCTTAEKLNVNLEEHNLYSYEALFMQKTKKKFDYLDRFYFELYVMEEINPLEYKYKVWFVQSLLSDKNYAYLWAKYFKIKDSDMPKELKGCSILFSEDDLLKFENKIKENVYVPVDRDHDEICTFFGRSYRLITIFTRDALNKFIKDFIKSKPKIIGIDIETGKSQEAATIQIATHDRLFLIHIHGLFKKISEDKWIHFFEILFDPSIIRVGFAFHNDFKFLCAKFPYLQEIFQDQQRKVLCLQKFANYLIEENIIVHHLFTALYSGSGLEKLTKAVLYLNMDKTEQQSDWTQIPLTQFQKIYAVVDALLVVLLKDEIQKCLEREFSAEKVNEIMEVGYICHENSKSTTPDCPTPVVSESQQTTSGN